MIDKIRSSCVTWIQMSFLCEREENKQEASLVNRQKVAREKGDM